MRIAGLVLLLLGLAGTVLMFWEAEPDVPPPAPFVFSPPGPSDPPTVEDVFDFPECSVVCFDPPEHTS